MNVDHNDKAMHRWTGTIVNRLSKEPNTNQGFDQLWTWMHHDWIRIWLKSPMFLNQMKHANPRLEVQSCQTNQLIFNQAIVTPWLNLNQWIRTINLKQITESFIMNPANQMQTPWNRVSTMFPGEHPWIHDFMFFFQMQVEYYGTMNM